MGCLLFFVVPFLLFPPFDRQSCFSAYHHCTDGHTGASAWCAGKHVLNSITPTVSQNGAGSALPAVTFQYQGLGNNYIDTSQTMSYGKYGSNNYWQYLHAFSDHSTGMTEFITYLTGDNNTHGTPNTGTDNRFDPTYCTIQGGCSGNFANQDAPAGRGRSRLACDCAIESVQPHERREANAVAAARRLCRDQRRRLERLAQGADLRAEG